MNDLLVNLIIPIIAVGLIALLLGGLIGALIALSLRPPASAGGQSPGKNFTPLMRIWRDRRGGKLAVDLEGASFIGSEKLSARQRAAVQQTIDELQYWIGGLDPARRLEAALPPVPAAVAAAVSPVKDPVIPPQAATYRPVEVGVALSPEVNEILARAIAPDLPGKEKTDAAAKSIAAQVDEILQDALPGSSLRDRSIRLVEIPGRGMLVMVDGKAYEGVGDVPDEQVRKLIQQCVAEWEKKA